MADAAWYRSVAGRRMARNNTTSLFLIEVKNIAFFIIAAAGNTFGTNGI
jgi:hypothetical protein